MKGSDFFLRIDNFIMHVQQGCKREEKLFCWPFCIKFYLLNSIKKIVNFGHFIIIPNKHIECKGKTLRDKKKQRQLCTYMFFKNNFLQIILKYQKLFSRILFCFTIKLRDVQVLTLFVTLYTFMNIIFNCVELTEM